MTARPLRLLRAFLVWAVLAMAAWLVVPAALGMQSVLIVGGSMAPGLRAGDVVHLDPDLPAQVRAGDVVVFEDSSRGGVLVTHRVAEVLRDGTYRTRGDANDAEDSTLVPHSALQGVGRWVVPGLGLPVLWLRAGAAGLVAGVAVAALLLAAAVRARSRPRPAALLVVGVLVLGAGLSASQAGPGLAAFTGRTADGPDLFQAAGSFTLTPVSGPGGCVGPAGGTCTTARALDGPDELAMSPGGETLYVASNVADSIGVYARDATTGGLTQPAGTAGCVSLTGTGGTCGVANALDGPGGLAVSPDGKHVYASSGSGAAVLAFSRASNGALTQLSGTAGCISDSGTGGTCSVGRGLSGVIGVTLSPDGKHVYAAAHGSDTVVVLQRNATTGAVTQAAGAAGCISETGSGGTCADGVALDGAQSVEVSPDDAFVYVTSPFSDAVAVLRRDTSTGALTQLAAPNGCVSDTGTGGSCVDGRDLDSSSDLIISPDGATLYVAAQDIDTVAVFRRDAASGQLTQLPGLAGCVSETGTAGTCTDGRALDEANAVLVTPDGRAAYVPSEISDAVAVFARDTSTGALTQPTTRAGCISETGTGGTCVDGSGLDSPDSVAVSPDGAFVYVAAELSDVVSVLRR